MKTYESMQAELVGSATEDPSALIGFFKECVNLAGVMQVTCANGRWIPSDLRCFSDCQALLGASALQRPLLCSLGMV